MGAEQGALVLPKGLHVVKTSPFAVTGTTPTDVPDLTGARTVTAVPFEVELKIPFIQLGGAAGSPGAIYLVEGASTIRDAWAKTQETDGAAVNQGGCVLSYLIPAGAGAVTFKVQIVAGHASQTITLALSALINGVLKFTPRP